MLSSKHLQATLTSGPVHRHLREMAVPMVWGLLATMSFNIVDTFFVAKLGDAPLAAMSFTLSLTLGCLTMMRRKKLNERRKIGCGCTGVHGTCSGRQDGNLHAEFLMVYVSARFFDNM